MKQRKFKFIDDLAVSPVVGVMLMLVVTIIIAAVVSGFAGNLATGSAKAPQLSMDTELRNSGYWQTSYFKAVVTGVSEPIDTADLKIVTSWSKTLNNGTTLSGGAEMIPGVLNFNVTYSVNGWTVVDEWRSVCPQGYGPGVETSANFWPFEPHDSGIGKGAGKRKGTMDDVWSGALTNTSWFGNYQLESGTIIYARPFGGVKGGQSTGASSYSTAGYGITVTGSEDITGQYKYAYGTIDSTGFFAEYPDSVDQMMAVLGENWNVLRAGDTVNVKFIHTPSGKIIWQKDITMEA
ncbi:MAG: type IV pilin N-terminal domain-containing protein [Methanomicrobium sp.]|nr:type IV pilin N-terminal domain-containing protein [Methanomicrobium sp.]